MRGLPALHTGASWNDLNSPSAGFSGAAAGNGVAPIQARASSRLSVSIASQSHSTTPEQCRTLTGTQAEAEGWFSGPPYAVAEVVFDEDDMAGCTLEPEPDEAAIVAPPPDTGIAADEWDSPATKAKQMACATALREPARAAGLRFEAYLPSSLADWLLAHVERGTFRDPSEAVFVILGEHEELEPHHDLREELLRRSIQAAIDDPRPGIPGEVVMERLRARMAAPRPEPAVWPKDRR